MVDGVKKVEILVLIETYQDTVPASVAGGALSGLTHASNSLKNFDETRLINADTVEVTITQ